jgi:hypothetical protein
VCLYIIAGIKDKSLIQRQQVNTSVTGNIEMRGNDSKKLIVDTKKLTSNFIRRTRATVQLTISSCHLLPKM